MIPQTIKNFINKETCDYIISYMKNSNLFDEMNQIMIYVNKEEGSNAICGGFYPEMFTLTEHMEKNGEKNTIIYDLLNLIAKSMYHVFDFKDSEVIYETMAFNLLTPDRLLSDGNAKSVHFDHYGEGGIIYTAILYLDDDYEGGELIVYDQNIVDEDHAISHKPEMGQLFYFDGYTPHAVGHVTSGERSNLVLHIRSDKVWGLD